MEIKGLPSRFLAATLSLAIASQSLIGAAPASAAVRPEALPAPAPALSVLTSVSGAAAAAIPDALRRIPARLGSVRDASFVPGSERLVIHLQDIHDNAEAQRNIRRTVESLVAAGAVDLIALEGASSELPLERFRTDVPSGILRAASDFLAREGRLTGPVQAALLASNAPPVVGVEDARLYRRNVDAYRRAAPSQARYRGLLEDIRAEFESRRERVFGRDLLDFDDGVRAYRRGGAPFGAYARDLARRFPGVSRNFRAFLSATEMEASLDFIDVETQRELLLRRLAARLDDRGRRELAERGLSFRLGASRAADFYEFLRAFCGRNGVALDAYPALNAYVHYVLLCDSIRVDALFAETRRVEAAVYDALAQGEAERRLVRDLRAADLVGRLVDFSMTEAEWAEFESIERTSVSIPWRGLPDLRWFEAFYRDALRRDRAIAARLTHEMRLRGARRALLVAGGFHAPGIRRHLDGEGIGSVAFVPRLTRTTGSGSEYLSVFAREKSPLEQLFRGERLFLARNPGDPLLELKLLSSALDADPAAAFDRLPPRVGARLDSRRRGDDIEARLRRPEGFEVVATISLAAGAIASVAYAGVTTGPGGGFPLFAALPMIVPYVPPTAIVLISIGAIVALFFVTARIRGWITWFDELRGAGDPYPDDSYRAFQFWPKLALRLGDAFNPRQVQSLTSDELRLAARRQLLAAQRSGNESSISASFRLADISGSALDLPKWQIRLQKTNPPRLADRLSTLTIASDLVMKVRFELIEDEAKQDIIEYQEPGMAEPIVFREPAALRVRPRLSRDQADQFEEKTANGYRDSIPYIFKNLFKVGGIRIIVDTSPPFAGMGGMEGSNVATQIFLTAAAMISGAQLTQADIFALSVKLENDVFGGITGGQGNLSAVMGGVNQHFWTYATDGYIGSISMPIMHAEEQIQRLESRIAIAQAGLEYKNGQKVIPRSSSVINKMWEDILEEDPRSRWMFQRMVTLSNRIDYALPREDYRTVVRCINEFVDMRNQVLYRWMSLIMDVHEGRIPSVPAATRWARRVFNRHLSPEHRHPAWENYKAIEDHILDRVPAAEAAVPAWMFWRHEWFRSIWPWVDLPADDPRRLSLYSIDPIAPLVRKARDPKWRGTIAVMPLGAGGPGAATLVFSSEGREHLSEFLSEADLPPIDDEELVKVQHGSGSVRGHKFFRIGREGIRIAGFDGINRPEGPLRGRVLQSGGFQHGSNEDDDLAYGPRPPAADSRGSLDLFANILPGFGAALLGAIALSSAGLSLPHALLGIVAALLPAVVVHELGHAAAVSLRSMPRLLLDSRSISIGHSRPLRMTPLELAAGFGPGLLIGLVLLSGLAGDPVLVGAGLVFAFINIFAMIWGDGPALLRALRQGKAERRTAPAIAARLESSAELLIEAAASLVDGEESLAPTRFGALIGPAASLGAAGADGRFAPTADARGDIDDLVDDPRLLAAVRRGLQRRVLDGRLTESQARETLRRLIGAGLPAPRAESILPQAERRARSLFRIFSAA